MLYLHHEYGEAAIQAAKRWVVHLGITCGAKMAAETERLAGRPEELDGWGLLLHSGKRKEKRRSRTVR